MNMLDLRLVMAEISNVYFGRSIGARHIYDKIVLINPFNGSWSNKAVTILNLGTILSTN